MTTRITQRELDNICEALLIADADIRDIILFGSFAYAPSLARDVDLVVTTGNRKDSGVYLERADENFLDAQNAQDLDIKDEAYRDAFNKFFDVARNAVMAYLGSEEIRWGCLRRSLPQPLEDRFREIIDTLHISYSYHGDYPKDSVDEEFERWRGS